MKRFNVILVLAVTAIILSISTNTFAGTFEVNISEIQVHQDRERLYVGTTYGTCGAIEGWWGWATGNPRYKEWLSMAMMAHALGKPVVVVDVDDSCVGPGPDFTGLESL